MTNAELIKALRICSSQPCCDNCPRYDIDHAQETNDCCVHLLEDATDALEADEKRIKELEKQEPTEKQVVDYCHKRCLVIVEEELFHRMKSTFSQLPKEGEWIPVDDGMVYVKCSVCGDVMCCRGHYCPNCGAMMDGKEQTDAID